MSVVDLGLLALPGDVLRMIYQMILLDHYTMLDMVSVVKRGVFGRTRDVDLQYLNMITIGFIRDVHRLSIVCKRLHEIYHQVYSMNPRLYTDLVPLTRYTSLRHYVAIVHTYSIGGRRRRLDLIKLMDL